ncbi:ankyrin repeat domain-containing protein 27-like isoform X5 [Ostrea edulis]|uniref:ankyrin repeat domain-containing protein 27-like isoform X5 n=1 Tax=Ostrea edulis TaxID=37623 RepID=UPI0024AF4955|nr:ankyrin repeat domain-containing protein 27-like isoform X5 [Ostrea edulis]
MPSVMEKYDEDIYENPFYTTLQNEFSQLYDEVTSLRCTLCIPQYSVAEKEKISEADLKDHILITEGGDDRLKTWSGKNVKIEEDQVKISLGQEESVVSILFEESFYNNNEENYQVLCTEYFINKPSGNRKKEETVKEAIPKDFEECKAYLFGHHGGKRLQESLEKQLESFSKQYRNLAAEKFIVIVNYESFEDRQDMDHVTEIQEVASTQFTKAMQTVLKDSSIRRRVHENKREMDMLKSAVEIYMMVIVHRGLFQAVQTNLAAEDAEVNKCARSLSNIKLDDLGVRQEFMANIRLARKELQAINKFCTPLGRLLCLKRVVSHLSTPTKDTNKKDAPLMLTTDEFLPIMIYLIIKSEIPNWMANLQYMKEFHFSRAYNFDEFMFYLTTVEAAVEHIKSGSLQKEAIKSYSLKDKQVNRQASGTSKSVDRFFSYVEGGDEAAVRLMLGKPDTPDEDVILQMCHPLCSCNKCRTLLRQIPTEKTLVTAYTRDDHGYTALHIAALHGQAHLVDLLVQHGAVVNASDYLGYTPLHLACQKGYQNVLLLLIHFGADCTQSDGVGNTPLHLCVDSGHEDCVKALVFADKARTHIDVNAQNYRRDTPLHLASKWGYESIIRILLDNHARTDIKNRKKQAPCHVAQNAHVNRIFHMYESAPKLLTQKQKSQGSVPSENVLNVNVADSKLFRPLHKACQAQNMDLVKLFINKGADANVQTKKGITPLHLASINKNTHIVFHLLKHGAKVNVRDSYGDTPLHLTCYKGCKDTLDCLLMYQAKVNISNSVGNTPLHIAVKTGNEAVVAKLLMEGAYPLARNKEGHTPFDYTKDPQIRDLLNAHITKRDLKATTPEITKDFKGPAAETPDSIRSMFAAFEERSRENLQTLTSSIKNVDRRESLKRTPQVNDRSSPDLRPLRHSLSIQNFDLGGLRHVELLDKSEPLYIYRLTMNMVSKNSESNETEVAAEKLEVEDDVLSEDKVSDNAHGAVLHDRQKNNIIHEDAKAVSEPLLATMSENSVQLERNEETDFVTDTEPMK